MKSLQLGSLKMMVPSLSSGRLTNTKPPRAQPFAVSQGHLYTDDRICDENGENCTIYFVVLDLKSGTEIARTEVAGTLPTIGHIFIGKNDAFYIATEAGTGRVFLTRISAQ